MNTSNWFLKRWFFSGLIFVLPLFITLAILIWCVEKANAAVLFMGNIWPLSLFPFHFPGLGLIFVVISIIVLGALTESVIVKQALRLFNFVMSKVPLVKSIHPTVLKFAETILGDSQEFRKVVLVRYPLSDVYMVGFVTGTAHLKISTAAGKKLVSVFIPNSPLPTTGTHLLVPEDHTQELSMSIEEAFKLVVSAGVVKEESLS